MEGQRNASDQRPATYDHEQTNRRSRGSAASRGSLLEASMKAKVTQDETGIQWEIKDDGSAEYQKAAQLTKEANQRERKWFEALREVAAAFRHLTGVVK
jgi:exonuclease I